MVGDERAIARAAKAAGAVDRARLWDYLQPFTTTVRTSGSVAEREAFDHAERIVRDLGYEVRRLEHDGYVSVPGAATLRIGDHDVPCITHAMAAATTGTTAPLVAADVRSNGRGDARLDGAIAWVHGLASPDAVHALERRGAVAAVFVNAERTYEMIVSPVWGSPDHEALHALPSIPVVSVASVDADPLFAAAADRQSATVTAEVDTRWRTLPLLEAVLRPERPVDRSLVLFSGHVDAWHLGAMDNGAANAVMLEVATLMAEHRSALARELRICFWSGHSHGRYAGSQWYADTHYLELRDRALLHVNVDSVGATGSTVLSEANCMPETFALSERTILDETGQTFHGARYPRAGDQSFWGLGVSSVWMGLSEQPAAENGPAAGYASMFGATRSGGFGWWWHTPEDTIERVDPVALERDARAYVRLIHRATCQTVAPLRYSAAARELREIVDASRVAVADEVDLMPAVERLACLERDVATLEAAWDATPTGAAADVQKALGRVFVPLQYVAGPVHQHDPALSQPPMPALAVVRDLARERDPDRRKHLAVAARRALNGVLDLLDDAMRTCTHALHASTVTENGA